MFEVYNNNGAKILSCNMELGKEGLQETEQVPMEYESDSLEQSTLLFEIDSEMVFSASDDQYNGDSISYHPSEYENDVLALLRDLHGTSPSEKDQTDGEGLSAEAFPDLAPLSELPVFTHDEVFPIDGSQSLRLDTRSSPDSSEVFSIS